MKLIEEINAQLDTLLADKFSKEYFRQQLYTAFGNRITNSYIISISKNDISTAANRLGTSNIENPNRTLADTAQELFQLYKEHEFNSVSVGASSDNSSTTKTIKGKQRRIHNPSLSSTEKVLNTKSWLYTVSTATKADNSNDSGKNYIVGPKDNAIAKGSFLNAAPRAIRKFIRKEFNIPENRAVEIQLFKIVRDVVMHKTMLIDSEYNTINNRISSFNISDWDKDYRVLYGNNSDDIFTTEFR